MRMAKNRGDHEADEPGALVIVALLVALPVLCGALLFLIAKRNPATTSDRDAYALVGVLAGFVIGAIARHRVLRRST
jgi:hypothetical protein